MIKDFKKWENLYYKKTFKDEYKRLKKLDMTKDFIKFCEILFNLQYKTHDYLSYGSYYRIKNKGVKFIKIASYDCSSLNFLKNEVLKLPMVVSTGATKKSEIINASKTLRNNLFAFLHCVTIYPTPLDKCNL